MIDTDKLKVTKLSHTPLQKIIKRHTARFSTPHIGCDNDGSNLSALINRQHQKRRYLSSQNIPFLSTWPTVVVQREDRELWMYGTMMQYGRDEHNDRSYRVPVMKIGCIISRMKRHVRATPISTEDCLRKEKCRSYRPHTNDMLNKLIKSLCYAEPTWTLKCCWNRGRRHITKMMQQPQHRNTDQPGEMKQSGSSSKITKNSKK